MKKSLRTLFISMLSLGSLAAFNLSAHAAKPLAKAGQVVVRVPAGQQPDALAASVGCTVLKPVAYCPGYYIFALKSYSALAKAEEPTSELIQVVTALRAKAGVIADPNWMVYPTGFNAITASKSKTRAQQPVGTRIVPNDAFFSRQWDMEMIRMPEAWNIQFGTVNPVLVSVIDSGIDPQHPDFKDTNGVSRIVAQQDFSGANAPNVDAIGHGTHVAGTIGATTNNAIGVTGVAGWGRNATNIKFINAKVFDTGGSSSDAIASAINYSVTQGARVINMSLGSVGPSTAQVEVDAVNNALKAKVVVVASAGNDDLDNDDPTQRHWPSDITGVIKVTSVGRTKAKASYSNYGGSTQIIAAPGGDGAEGGPDAIWSTVPVAGSQIAGANAGGYYSINGTSMASPHVAGAAALLIAAGAPPDQVYPTLRDTAQPVSPANTAVFGPGIMDVYSALYVWADPDPVIVLEGAQDRGVSYFGATPLSISLVGVSKIIAGPAIGPQVSEQDVTVEIQTVGRNPTTIYSFVGGRNVTGQPNRFEIPVITSGGVKAQRFSGIPVPALNTDGTYTPPKLTPGQYKIVARVRFRDASGNVTDQESVQFITIAQKVLPAGRSMFAIPFKAGTFLRQNPQDSILTPERAVLGRAASFGLARYNPLRGPADDDYARYRANDPYALKSPARFDILDSSDSRVLTFETTDPSVSIAPIGLGFWLDLDQATIVDTTLLPYPGQIASVNPVAVNSVGIRVFASGGGWNMIGAPFTYPVDWSVVTVIADGVSYSMADAVSAGIISPALIGYANGDYVYAIAPAGQLEPFNGYWVRVFRDCVLVVPPVPSAVISRSKLPSSSSEGWRGRLIASVAGDIDGQNYFGLAAGAQDGDDRLDIVKPPLGAGHAYVRFIQDTTQGKSRSLAFDLRAITSTAKQEWTAVVSSDRANATVQLSWDGIRSAPKNARLVLKDMTTGQVIPMASRSSYSFRSGEAGSSRLIKISLEPQMSGGILAIRNLRTAGAGGRGVSTVTARFNTNVDAEIQGTIETLGGRSVAALVGTGRATAGSEASLRWDGRNNEGGVVPAGPYVMKVTARSTDGQVQTIQRIIQVIR